MRYQVNSAHAMGRLEEPADAVVELCSERVSIMTGHDPGIDGGLKVWSNVIDL